MIFIDRNLVDAPEELTDENGAGKKELAKAIAHYTGPDKEKAYDKYNAYKHDNVKDALKKLSNNKCAYCESIFLHAHVGDIEHFRPKGGVEFEYRICQHCDQEYPRYSEGVIENKVCTHCGEAPSGTKKQLKKLLKKRMIKPGYYWLAADWDNLFLSCRNCNQKSKQLLANATELESVGKMNQFPLLKEELRLKTHTEKLKKEEKVRLLINPSIEDPEEYFEYDIESGVIRAKKTDDLTEKRAIASIKVYSLQRVPLVHLREKKIVDISRQMKRVEKAMRNVNKFYDENDEETHSFVEDLKFELGVLKEFIDTEKEFVGLAKQMIGTFLLENFQIDINAA
ncbi:hypothetical protein [Kordia sp.]|uniref:hypothetical protein n=1 Tax=Kordia sp. TaxID=1965332 RepID=UPI003B58EE92